MTNRWPNPNAKSSNPSDPSDDAPQPTDIMASGRPSTSHSSLYDDQINLSIPLIPEAILRSLTIETCHNNTALMTIVFVCPTLPPPNWKDLCLATSTEAKVADFRHVTTTTDIAPQGWYIGSVTLPACYFTVKSTDVIKKPEAPRARGKLAHESGLPEAV